MRKFIIRSLVCCCSAFLFISCNSFSEVVTPTPEGEYVEVTLAAGVNVVNTPATRAMDYVAESRLTHIDILVFEAGQDGEERFSYRTHNTNTIDTGLEKTYIKARMKVSENNERYRVVILANLRAEANAVLEDESSQGMLKEELLEKIKITQAGRWPADNDLGYKALPMWGEAPNVTPVTINTVPSSFGEIPLQRSVARIEVAVSITGEDNTVSDGTDFFIIEEVKVYNARSEGYAVPLDGTLDAAGKAQTPSIVTGSGVIEADRMAYPVNAVGSTPYSNQLRGSIYVNEALNSEAAYEEAMFLIIKGYYTEDHETEQNTTNATYYRIDFIKSGIEPEERCDILRNFTYNVIITDVFGSGYEDEEDAVKSVSKGMNVSITDWSNGEMEHVVFHGPYYLAVSKSTIELPGDAATESFLVKTNYPTGWKAEVSEGSPWLGGLNPGSSTILEQSVPLSFTVTENGENDPRSGKIGISCGTALTLDVVVIQHTTAESELSIKILEVTSLMGAVGTNELDEIMWWGGLKPGETIMSPKGFHIDWMPSWAYCNMIKDPAGTYDVETVSWMFEAGKTPSRITHFDEMVIPPTDYGYTFYLTPRRFQSWQLVDDPFFEQATNYYFTVIDGDKLASKTIRLRQVHYNLIADVADGYVLDGSTHSFKVRANRDWTVKNITGDTEFISSYTTGGNSDKVHGTDFRFTVVNDPDKTGSVTVTFSYWGEVGGSISAPAGIEYTEQVVINFVKGGDGGGSFEVFTGGEANCYILQPGGQGVVIPVSQANKGVNIRIGDNTELEPKFIWTDNPNGMDDGGAVSRAEIYGSGTDAKLVVYPGTGEGNAVVAVTDENTGTVLWSWHLWVTNFNPEDDENDFYGFNYYKFLDRNLGALSEDPADYRSQGLFYQWGRKDPFPYAKGIGSTSFIDIYDEDGNKLRFPDDYKTTAGSGIMLDQAIENPLNLITIGYADWYSTTYATATSAARRQMWHPGATIEDVTKGAYDPCPDGWRVTPGSNSNNISWYSLFTARTHYTGYSEVNGNIGSNYVDLGVWPHAGMINGGTGQLESGASIGRYWTANVNSTSVGSLYVGFENQWSTQLTTDYDRRHALSIRCMKRTDTKM